MLDQIFKGLLSISLVAWLYFMYLTVSFYQVSREAKPVDTPEMVSIFDFRWALISATVLHFFKTTLTQAVEPMIRPICKNQDDPDLLKVRSNKAALTIYKFIVYCA
jgi:hypothetical protein